MFVSACDLSDQTRHFLSSTHAVLLTPFFYFTTYRKGYLHTAKLKHCKSGNTMMYSKNNSQVEVQSKSHLSKSPELQSAKCINRIKSKSSCRAAPVTDVYFYTWREIVNIIASRCTQYFTVAAGWGGAIYNHLMLALCFMPMSLLCSIQAWVCVPILVGTSCNYTVTLTIPL